MNPILILGLAAAAIFLLKAKDNILNQLTFSFAGLIPDILNLRLRLKLNINNPLPTEVPVSTLIGSVSVSDKTVAEFANSQGFVLQPGQNTIEISAFPLLANVVSASSDILKGRINLNYTITSGPLSYSSSIIFIQ